MTASASLNRRKQPQTYGPRREERGAWKRYLVLAYGTTCYLTFLGVFLYLAAFLGNVLVPRPIDSVPTSPPWTAAGVNLVLIALFGLQHTVMARPTFKRWWTRLVPEPIERSTYVMATNLVLVLLLWHWQPMGSVLWDLRAPAGRIAMQALFGLGWLTVLITTFLINHFDLFGLRQVWLYFRKQPYHPIPFRSPGPYRYVRHPLYVGWIVAFWATPTMTAAHLLFAVGMTAYILIAIRFEERNLADYHGGRYAEYRRRVPMLIPRLAALPPALDHQPCPDHGEGGALVS